MEVTQKVYHVPTDDPRLDDDFGFQIKNTIGLDPQFIRSASKYEDPDRDVHEYGTGHVPERIDKKKMSTRSSTEAELVSG